MSEEHVHYHFTVLGGGLADTLQMLAGFLEGLQEDCPFNLQYLSPSNVPDHHQAAEPQRPATPTIAAVANTNESQEQRIIECKICLGPSADMELPCRHRVCLACVRPWLLRRSICPDPFCKRPCLLTDLTPVRY